jgi:hypothetical protein
MHQGATIGTLAHLYPGTDQANTLTGDPIGSYPGSFLTGTRHSLALTDTVLVEPQLDRLNAGQTGNRPNAGAHL